MHIHLMKEAVAVLVSILAGQIATSGLDGNVDSTDRCYGSSCEEDLCEQSHD